MNILTRSYFFGACMMIIAGSAGLLSSIGGSHRLPSGLFASEKYLEGGRVAMNVGGKASIVLYNLSSPSLRIKAISGCGCIRADVSKASIGRFDSARLGVTIQPGITWLGEHTKDIALSVSDGATWKIDTIKVHYTVVQ